MTQRSRINLFDPEVKPNAYAAYAQLRSKGPVSRVTLKQGQNLWLVTGYDEAVSVLKDRRFASNAYDAPSPEESTRRAPLARKVKGSFFMVSIDPPDHTRLRRLIHKAFEPRLIESLRPYVQRVTDELLYTVERRAKVSGKREMDLIDDYAFPIPLTITTELLGVPKEDRDTFRKWSYAMMGSANVARSAEELMSLNRAFSVYLRELIEEKLINPEDDLISRLVQAEVKGDKLDQSELMSMVGLVIAAGHESTVSLIGNGALALLEHPDQLEKLKKDPSLIKLAVEEILRYYGPAETTASRFAREDVELSGKSISKGEEVLVVLAAADRDPTRFDDPDRLDITREDNRHLAFGRGIHTCLGAPLARLEGQVAIGTLFRRMPNLRVNAASEELTWLPGRIVRGLSALPVTF